METDQLVRTSPAGTETREWARVKAGNRAASLRWGKVAGHAGDGLEVLVGSGLTRRHHQRDQRLTPDRYQSGVVREQRRARIEQPRSPVLRKRLSGAPDLGRDARANEPDPPICGLSGSSLG